MAPLDRGEAVNRLSLLLRAARAIWRAYRRARRGTLPRPFTRKQKNRDRRRRRAVNRLGGACACCGLGLDYARALVFHHVNFNGKEHREALAAVGMSITRWVLTADRPGVGLFAVEVLCETCHRMVHEHGACLHRSRSQLRAAG